MITLYNRTGHSIEIYNQDPAAAVGAQISTGTGTTFAVYNGRTVTMRYDATALPWEIISSHFTNLDNFGSAWAANANDIYNTNSGNIGLGTDTQLEKLSVIGNMDITGELKTSGLVHPADILQILDPPS